MTGSPRSTAHGASSAIHATCSAGRVLARRARPVLSRTGRPAKEEWASEPSRCTSPSRARPSNEIPARALRDEISRPLNQASSRDQFEKALAQIGACMALGVCDDRTNPARGKAPDELIQFDAERTGSRLQQYPAVACEREPAQLLHGEALRGALCDLAPREHPHANPLTQQLPLQQSHAPGQLRDVDVMIITDVRCGAHDRNPVCAGPDGPSPRCRRGCAPRHRAPAGCGSGHRPARGRPDSPSHSWRRGEII